MAVIYGIHGIEQALAVHREGSPRAARRPLEQLLVARGRGGREVQQLVEAARAARVPVRFVQRRELDRLTGTRAHQGVAAVAGAKRYLDLEELLGAAKSPALFVLLDGVEDPRNLGAILRTAVCAGADGVILPLRRATGVTPAAEKVAAGAAEHISVARVVNLGRALDQLKEAGCWLVGLDADGERAFTEVDLTVSVGLVLGGEGKGLHQQVRKRCDFVVKIPTVGPVGSLNVSVAAGVALYEVLRQRRVRSTSSKLS